MAEPGLAARGLGLSLARRPVLRDVTVTLAPGEVLALVGPNGAGKSSLLACLSGALRPDRGTVRLDGADPARLRPADLAGLRAVLDQGPLAPDDVTVADLALLPLGREIAPGAARALVAQALALVDLTGLADRPLGQVSGGQRQRAHLARAIVQILGGRIDGGGRYLLLDEPTAGLDLGHQAGVLRAVRVLAARGTGVLVVLHDLALAAAMADRVALMDGGRIVALGPPARVLTAERIGALYGLAVTTLTLPGGGLGILPCFTDAG